MIENIDIFIGSISVALSWSISSIVQKDILKKISPNKLFLLVSILLFIILVTLALLTDNTSLFSISDMDLYTIFQILVITIVGFLIPYSLLLNLINNNDVNRVISLAYITPIITVFLAWIFIGENINIYSILGSVFIVLGSYIIVNFTNNTK